MSDNSQVIILRNKESGLPFEVHHNFCVDNDFVPDKETFLQAFKGLQEAAKWAEKYSNDNLVEYGVYISSDCWLSLGKQTTNPIQILINHGFEKLRDDEVYGLESKDFFYVTDTEGETHYFKSKKTEVEDNDKG